jgi:bacterioferritin
MRGNKEVIAELNTALHSELTAIVQYMVQSELCNNWGYKRLGSYLQRRAIDEMHHAEGLIERIVFFDTVPKVNVALKPIIDDNVKAQLEADLKDEHDAIGQYNASAKICVTAADNGSRDLFEKMIKDEEGHALFLEGQLHAIGEMGIADYLAEQMHEDEEKS